jgi:hypothetical protein
MVDMSDTPAGMISRLDDALRRRGQDIVLRNGNTTAGQVTVRAHVRTVKARDELIGGLVQGDKIVRISPTGLGSFGEPKKGQIVVIEGKPHAIVAEPEFLRPAGTLARINMIVRGLVS